MTDSNKDVGLQGPPRVSVLITTYNAAAFITETISSVLDQSFRDFELVVVDDGSTDETLATLAGFVDPRLRVLRTPRNLGIVGARNFGYRMLRGAYVATLDHDDVWRPARLEKGVVILDAQPTTVLVGTQTAALVRGQVVKVDRPRGVTPTLLRWLLLMDCPVVYSSLLFRREAGQLSGGDFMRSDALYADDYELMLRLSGRGDCVVIDAPLTLHRVHEKNATPIVAAEMEQNAVRVLTEVYARWLGDEAAVAAKLMSRHVARRRPATSLGELNAIATVLMRLRDSFLATYLPDRADRRLITCSVRNAYWRVVRATIRSGRIGLVSCYLHHPSLAISRRLLVDLALSLAAGLVKLAFRPDR